MQLALSAPTAVIGLLRVHPSGAGDLQGPEDFAGDLPLQPTGYIDAFGNRCGRIQVAQGLSGVALRKRARIFDSGLPDGQSPAPTGMHCRSCPPRCSSSC